MSTTGQGLSCRRGRGVKVVRAIPWAMYQLYPLPPCLFTSRGRRQVARTLAESYPRPRSSIPCGQITHFLLYLRLHPCLAHPRPVPSLLQQIQLRRSYDYRSSHRSSHHNATGYRRRQEAKTTLWKMQRLQRNYPGVVLLVARTEDWSFFTRTSSPRRLKRCLRRWNAERSALREIIFHTDVRRT